MKAIINFPLGAPISGLLMTAVLSACSMAPYVKPVINADQVSTLPSVKALADPATPDAAAPEPTSAPPSLWWTQLGDGQLNGLIDLAWENNYDLRIAVARMTAARELGQAAEGARLPGATLDASASRGRQAAIESRSGTSAIVSSLQWQEALSWELDLFGRVRHTIEAAQASADERAAVRDDVRRLILAQVIQAYLELRGAQTLASSLRTQLDNQSKSLQLVLEREQVGSAAPAERMRFEAQMRLTSARLPALAAQERAARNRLATLTGQRLDSPHLAALDQPLVVQSSQALVTDEPVRLLLRRPDVRVAERTLAVSAAREGIAYADLFPKINLSVLFGGLGVAGDWLTGDARRWRAGSALSWAVFDGGTRRAQLRAAGADVQAARANFDKVVAVALEEVDTAISNWTQLRQRTSELTKAHALSSQVTQVARVRYQEGAESMLGLLDAQRLELAAEEQLLTAKRELTLATARCYVAMAGGFDTTADQSR